MTNLTDTQVAEVLAPSKKYAPAQYAAAFDEAMKLGGAQGIETDFPGVKPQHVAHMLKALVAKRTRKGAKKPVARVAIDARYGVCLIPASR